MKYSFAILTIVFFLATASVSAQETIVKNASPFKPPAVKTMLGIRSGNDTVHIEEATQLVKLPLVVKDEKGNNYKIENYRLLYRRKGYVENLETGKPELHTTVVASRFDQTPLPKIWYDNIQLTLKSGEELYFFEILVSDKGGKEFYAPDVRIVVQ